MKEKHRPQIESNDNDYDVVDRESERKSGKKKEKIKKITSAFTHVHKKRVLNTKIITSFRECFHFDLCIAHRLCLSWMCVFSCRLSYFFAPIAIWMVKRMWRLFSIQSDIIKQREKQTNKRKQGEKATKKEQANIKT